MTDRKIKQRVKCIFQERSNSISVVASKVLYDEEVTRDKAYAHVDTYADYIPDLRVLVVDQVCVVENDWRGFDLQWSLPDRRIMETCETEAAAVRRAVTLADNYFMQLIETAVDDDRTEEEILATYRETHQHQDEEFVF